MRKWPGNSRPSPKSGSQSPPASPREQVLGLQPPPWSPWLLRFPGSIPSGLDPTRSPGSLWWESERFTGSLRESIPPFAPTAASFFLRPAGCRKKYPSRATDRSLSPTQGKVEARRDRSGVFPPSRRPSRACSPPSLSLSATLAVRLQRGSPAGI